MARIVAVNWYADNFLTGTMFMTWEQKGRYVSALCAQQLHGHLTFEQLNSFCGDDEMVLEKFIKDENGLYFNERMDDEIKKRIQFSEHQRDRASKRWGKDDAGEMPGHNSGTDSVLPVGNGIGNGIGVGKEEGNERKNLIKAIVAFLNEKCGTSFRDNNRDTVAHINRRLEEKYTVDDFKAVIEFKKSEWFNDPEMKEYLRPKTLFGTKFEGYLQAAKQKNTPKGDIKGCWRMPANAQV